MTRICSALLVVAAAAACASRDEKRTRPTEADTLPISRSVAAAAPAGDTAPVSGTVHTEPLVFGYVMGARFYPLVVLDAGGFDSERAATLRLGQRPQVRMLTNPDEALQAVLVGRELRALANAAHVMEILAETTYVDPYVEERPGRFGAVTALGPGVVVFAYLSPSPEAVDFRSDTIAVRSFYRFFSRDRWGANFLDEVSLDAPLQTIADSSNVRAYGLTDADRDGNPELWLTYQLMYGEIGAMVWERAPAGWHMLAYHCFSCD